MARLNISGITYYLIELKAYTKIPAYKQIPKNMRHYQKHLKKTPTDTQIKFYKVVARPTLLHGNETWVTTTKDMTRLEAAERRFLRSVKGYTRLDKIRNKLIKKN
jgi:hypothetical protein